MAKVFYNAIVNASNFGLLQPIRQPYSQPLRQCANVSDSANNWCIQSPVYPSRGQLNFFFGVNCTDSSSSSTQCTCKDSYSDSFAVPKTGSCLEMSTTYTTAVRWADLNGDGRPENVYITPAGALNTSLSLGIYQYNNGFYNQYACQNINSSFKELGVIAPGPQTKRYQVSRPNKVSRVNWLTQHRYDLPISMPTTEPSTLSSILTVQQTAGTTPVPREPSITRSL